MLIAGSTKEPRELSHMLLERKEYSGVLIETMDDYILAAKAPENLWSQFTKKKISYSVLREIMRCNLDPSTAELLTQDAIAHGLGRASVDKFRKAFVRERRSYVESLQIATGEVVASPIGQINGNGEVKSINDLASEIATAGTRLRARIEMVSTVAPDNKTAESLMAFSALWHLRQALKDMLTYLDDRIKASISKVQGQQAAAPSKEVPYAAREEEGSGGEEGGGPAAEEASGHVADPAGQDHGA